MKSRPRNQETSCSSVPTSDLSSHMLLTSGSPSNKKQNPSDGESIEHLFKTGFILRIGAGLALASFHAWRGALGGYEFLWHEKPWDWVTALTEAHAPYPHLLAPAAAAVIAAIALSWITGFLTRLFAFAAIPVGIGALVVAQRLDSAQVETCWLYIIIAVTLMLFGSGNLSLDGLFKLGGRTKKETPDRW